MALVDHWPLFGLRVRTPRLELRYPDDELLCALIELVVSGGIHPPDEMPFGVPWTDAPPELIGRNALQQHHWRQRVELSPERWGFDLAVLVDGEPAGAQGLVAEHFPERRGVSTGSWLGRAHQGRGIGTEMRRAILHLAFAGLGAELAETGAWHDNHASLGVTTKLGYSPCGDGIELRRGRPDRMRNFRMERAWWEEHLRADDVTVEGLDPCLPLLGARDDPPR